MRSRWLLLAIALLLSACGKDSEPTSRSYYDLATSLEDTRRESTRWLGPSGDHARAVWDHVAGSEAWTKTALTEITQLRPALERTRDRDTFCPGYDQATDFQKDTCWLRLLSAMARFESNFKPDATYLETSGRNSVGLLMMNPSHCPAANTEAKLKNPLLNIQCATKRLLLLTQRDGWLSGPGNSGGAAYWSVLREPYQNGATLLGRKPHIEMFTRSYRAFREP